MPHNFLKNGEYSIKKSTIPNAGKGAFANVYIKKGTVLGEYHGKILSRKQYESMDDDDQAYVWEVSSPSGPFYIDGGPVKKNNWLRFLNDSRSVSKNNVQEYQYAGRVFYKAIKNIKPGSELFVDYGDYYFD